MHVRFITKSRELFRGMGVIITNNHLHCFKQIFGLLGQQKKIRTFLFMISDKFSTYFKYAFGQADRSDKNKEDCID